MARSYSFVVERRGRASAEKAFALIRDAEAWVRWAGPPISYSAWKEDGPSDGTADGSVVGRTRLVGNRRFPAAEQITIDEAPHTHGYRIPAVWPVRDYSAVVTFTEDGSGVLTVRWSGQFTERIPGTGYLWRRFLQRLLGRFARRLIAHSAA